VWQLKADRANEVVIESDTPVFDVRGANLGNHHIRLHGENPEFVPKAFLTPEEFEGHPDIQTGKPHYAAEYYTARFRILVPDGKLYAVTFSSVDYADNIYINGAHMQSVGRPGMSADAAIPKTRMFYYTVQPVDGVIEVLHQVSNFVHKEGGNPTDLYIGSVESAGLYYNRQTLVTAIVMGACLLLFIVHLVLFALFKSYRANLYFALFCFVWMLRTGVVGVNVITLLLPDLSWYAKFRIEYMAIPIAALLLSLALDAMFDGLLHKWGKRVIIAVNAAAALVFLTAPTLFMTHALPYVYVTTMLCAVYVLACFLIGLRSHSGVRQSIILCGLVVFIYLALREMLYHQDVLIFPAAYTSMMDFATLVFILFQMVASFHGTMQEVVAARENERRLAMENAALDRMNKMRAEFFSNISHEMKMPLTVMSGYAQITGAMLEHGMNSGDMRDNLSRITDEAEGLAKLVGQLLHITRIQENKASLCPTNITETLRETADAFSPLVKEKENELHVCIPAGLPSVIADAVLIGQVVRNLLANANAHTENGRIGISAAAVEKAIEVVVADTGTGIAPELLPHLFERYRTGGEKGTGLGLAICKEIIAFHGREITVQSEPGKGTAVRFTLPFVKEGNTDEQ